jgi:hypothetical protein
VGLGEEEKWVERKKRGELRRRREVGLGEGETCVEGKEESGFKG